MSACAACRFYKILKYVPWRDLDEQLVVSGSFFKHILHLELSQEECVRRRTAKEHNPNPLTEKDVLDLAPC